MGVKVETISLSSAPALSFFFRLSHIAGFFSELSHIFASRRQWNFRCYVFSGSV